MLVYFQGLRARRLAEAWCKQRNPDEIIHGTWICANEPTRFVVRVFCGQRERTGEKLPPWQNCSVIAVDKRTLIAAPVADDAPYRPILR